MAADTPQKPFPSIKSTEKASYPYVLLNFTCEISFVRMLPSLWLWHLTPDAHPKKNLFRQCIDPKEHKMGGE